MSSIIMAAALGGAVVGLLAIALVLVMLAWMAWRILQK